jgi:ABC-type lipopolysaccharide export system ATPase subunit
MYGIIKSRGHLLRDFFLEKCPHVYFVSLLHYLLTFLLLYKQYVCFFCLSASCLKSSKPNTIVLSGLSGSGKTTLFYQVIALFGSVVFGVLRAKNNELYIICKNDVIQVPFHAFQTNRKGNGLLEKGMASYLRT